MKRLMIFVFAMTTTLVACQQKPTQQVFLTEQEESDTNAWLVSDAQKRQADAAIVRESAVYDHYFVVGSSQLNELGEHVLTVLAAHFSENPGQLSVRRGDADTKLQKERIKTVVESLKTQGVDTKRMRVGDDLPGGDGLGGEEVLIVLFGPDGLKK